MENNYILFKRVCNVNYFSDEGSRAIFKFLVDIFDKEEINPEEVKKEFIEYKSVEHYNIIHDTNFININDMMQELETNIITCKKTGSLNTNIIVQK